MKINILIFSGSEILRKGLTCILEADKEFKVIGSFFQKKEISEQLLIKKPDLIILDPESLGLNIQEIKAIKKTSTSVKILTVTGNLDKTKFGHYLENGVNSCLLTDCESEEIIEAIHKTQSGERFLCGKIADILLSDKNYISSQDQRQISCAGFGISDREAEIIQLIAAGFSNKQIADKLYLSTHTVNTHRKNIFSKLGVNNTAGVVMFAVRHHLLEPNQFLFSN